MFGGFARLSEAPRSPSEQLRIAIAGPLVTLLLAVVLLGGVALLDSSGLSPPRPVAIAPIRSPPSPC